MALLHLLLAHMQTHNNLLPLLRDLCQWEISALNWPWSNTCNQTIIAEITSSSFTNHCCDKCCLRDPVPSQDCLQNAAAPPTHTTGTILGSPRLCVRLCIVAEHDHTILCLSWCLSTNSFPQITSYTSHLSTLSSLAAILVVCRICICRPRLLFSLFRQVLVSP
jgi:hypothetical protein